MYDFEKQYGFIKLSQSKKDKNLGIKKEEIFFHRTSVNNQCFINVGAPVEIEEIATDPERSNHKRATGITIINIKKDRIYTGEVTYISPNCEMGIIKLTDGPYVKFLSESIKPVILKLNESLDFKIETFGKKEVIYNIEVHDNFNPITAPELTPELTPDKAP